MDYKLQYLWRKLSRLRSIYQNFNMALKLSGQTSVFGVVFFVSKSLLGIKRQKKLKLFTILTRKPRSHVRILIISKVPYKPFAGFHGGPLSWSN